MHASGDRHIDDLIERQQPGYALERAFYTDAAIFERDRRLVFRNHWFMAAHASQLAESGDYRLFDIAGENIILIRGRDGEIHAHYNVCRHRGSRVLQQLSGNAPAMTCPYHGWTYAQDGALRAAMHMPEGFDRSRFGLMPCRVMVLEGLVFISPGTEGTQFDAVAEALKPFLALHGVGGARVADQRTFPVRANWKLAVENYLECYHCKPAHREYCAVEIKADRIGDGSPAALRRYEARERDWRTQAERMGTLLADVGTRLPLDETLPTAPIAAAYRAPLRASHVTATEDGRPAAPLMGRFAAYDGGETALAAEPFTYMLAYNDHAVFFAFVPRDVDHTDIVCTWLVHEDAQEGRDYDPGRLTWLWTRTTEQDKAIIQANAAGISSPSFQPGPASVLEADVAAFREWYLSSIGPAQRPCRLRQVAGGRYFTA
jgi:Rieske 2Fe-2S family protein